MRKISDVNLGMHLLEVEVTTRCNLDCTHCYNRNKEAMDMPIEEIFSLFEFAKNYGISSFVVSGGEASLHPQFDSIAEFLLEQEVGLRTVLQTNGAVANKRTELLRGFRVIHLSFEPDGSGVRKGSTEELIQLALRLNREGIYVYLFATVHKDNIAKIDWMVETANDFGLDIGFNLCVSTHRDPGLMLSVEQVKSVTEKLHGLYLEKKILRFTSPLVAILGENESEKYIGNRGGCTAGIASCVVLPGGDVVPCPFLRIRAGNIHEENLPGIWLNSQIFKDLRDRSRFDEPCGSCQFISYCGGCRKRALDSSGKLKGSDPACFL